MSGKGKKKEKSKSRPDEVEFNNRFINLKRLAYDVIRSTALRFRVPESCIAVWDGASNDYGKENLLLVVCVKMTEYQITNRRSYHSYFSKYCEKNELSTPEHIFKLLSETIDKETSGKRLIDISILKSSLSIACDLYLFLYSKNIDLNPKKLALYWFECTKKHKKSFEKMREFEVMYFFGSRQNLKAKDSFLKKFIEAYCIPYEASVKNERLGRHFDFTTKIFDRSAKSLAEEGTEEAKKQFARLDDLADTLVRLKINNVPTETDVATGSNLTEDACFPSTPLDHTINVCSSFVTSSHNLPAASCEEQLRRILNLSHKERTRMIRARMRSSREQAIRSLPLASSGVDRSGDGTPSAYTATSQAQSSKNQGVGRKDRVRHVGSSDLQTERQSRMWSSREQAPGNLILVASGVDRSGDQKPSASMATGQAQSYTNQGVRPKDQTEPLQQGIRRLTLGSLGRRTSNQEVTRATGDAQSHERQGTETTDRARDPWLF